MIYLVCGLVLFFIPHLLREVGLREFFIHRLASEGAYKGLYSLLSLAGLGLIIWSKASTPFIMLWQPVYEQRSASGILMIPALVLLAAGNMPMSNIRKLFRNPMLLGVLLWSLAHLWSNGDLVSVILFGSFGLWAALKFTTLGLAAGASSSPASVKWDVFAILGGLTAYVLLFLYHGQLFGVGLSLD